MLILAGSLLTGPAQAAPGRANAVSVIIGNQIYLGETPDVDFAHNDADAVRLLLIEHLGFDEANIIDLRDATKAAFEATFGNERTHRGKLFQWADGEYGEVIVYYSGHGVPDDEGRSYLLPVDGDPNFAEAVGYPLDMLYANLTRIDAPSITVILDACFSGRSPGGGLLAGRGVVPTPRDVAVPSQLTVLAAAGPSQIARWDAARRHGLFTAHLLDAFAGHADRDPYGNDDGVLTLAEAGAFLVRTVRRASRRQFSEEQIPVIEGAPDFVLAALLPEVVEPTPPPPPPPALLELAFWDTIKNSGNQRLFEAYLAKYPNGEFVLIAQLRIEELGEVEVAAATPLLAPEAERQATFDAGSSAMQPALHPALIEQGRHGLLPVVAADGRQSWQVYARPYDDSDERPKIVLIMIGLGISNAGTNKAVRMPGEVTLAFSPYGQGSEGYVREARAGGHEVLLEVPMEPMAYPTDDPGPRALMTSLGPRQNLERLTWLLARFAGYVGIIESFGGRFTDSKVHLEPIMFEIGRRGLIYVARNNTISDVSNSIADKLGMLHTYIDLDLDSQTSHRDIESRLAAAELLAERECVAVLMARAYPVTLELLGGWILSLEQKGFSLAPLTAAIVREASR